ncbi:hypothetical protein EAH76_05290 [Sphingomonas glacialis]|uniref:Uncharacterized protein n=1 Tax=Sphingomonas glacialis TaxID=658225 RepID=A0A502FX94_9SPHN|nr:hypothetical protein EAH76_05290 [Sphingomonas glacialis]
MGWSEERADAATGRPTPDPSLSGRGGESALPSAAIKDTIWPCFAVRPRPIGRQAQRPYAARSRR